LLYNFLANALRYSDNVILALLRGWFERHRSEAEAGRKDDGTVTCGWRYNKNKQCFTAVL